MDEFRYVEIQRIKSTQQKESFPDVIYPIAYIHLTKTKYESSSL